jgi:hypothetical protein
MKKVMKAILVVSLIFCSIILGILGCEMWAAVSSFAEAILAVIGMVGIFGIWFFTVAVIGFFTK